MNINAIETALGQHLAGMSGGHPIAWANKAAQPAKPYLRARHDPVSQVNPSIDGSTGRDEIGLWLVTVVCESDKFTGEGNTIAQAVADRFRQGLRISGTGGVVVVYRVEIVGGFHDKQNDWNIPVRVTYRTES